MININRNLTVPQSLATDEITQYLDEFANYKRDPDNNPKPGKPASYRTSDLLEALDRDFLCKCYMTEQKYANSWAMDIEHLIPQVERPDLIYEWTNLFPADHISNMIKPRGTPDGGYLDPSHQDDDVETAIIYTLSAHGYDPDFIPNDNEDVKAINTCGLLNRVHNGHNENTRRGTATLRHAIHKKYIDILQKIIEWHSVADGTQEKIQFSRELRDLLSRRSSFTMLMRSMPAVRQHLNEGDFFD